MGRHSIRVDRPAKALRRRKNAAPGMVYPGIFKAGRLLHI